MIMLFLTGYITISTAKDVPYKQLDIDENEGTVIVDEIINIERDEESIASEVERLKSHVHTLQKEHKKDRSVQYPGI